MDGIHDLGGKAGYGKVDRSEDATVFHERWEAGVFAMVNAAAAAGAFDNSDQFRHAIERINPVAYLEHGYYGRWLGGIESLLVESGLLSQDEVNARALELGAKSDDLVAAQPDPSPPLQQGRSTENSAHRNLDKAPRFEVGGTVKTQADIKPGHTRLPAYARDKVGEIILVHGGWVYPDTNAHGQGEHPQHLYTVRFSSEELWQKPGFSVSLDLFEPYLSADTGGGLD